MIFKSIIITEGFFSRKIDFDENVNLIFSKKIVEEKLHYYDLFCILLDITYPIQKI